MILIWGMIIYQPNQNINSPYQQQYYYQFRPYYPPPPPTPYYYPAPYFYPTPQAPNFETNTTKGLFFMLIGGIIAILAIFVLTFLVVVGWIISAVGFLLVYGDRYSYQEKHQTNMKHSMLSYIIGLSIFLSGCLGLLLLFLYGFPFNIITGISESKSGNFILLFFIILVIFFGASLRFYGRYELLSELIPPHKKGTLRFAFLFVFIAIALILILLYTAFRIQEIYFILFYVLIIGSLVVLTHLLFIYCFYLAYEHQRRNPQLRVFGYPGMNPANAIQTVPQPFGYIPPLY